MSRWKFLQGAMMICTAMLVLAGCVSQQKYDTLDAQYQQLNQTMSAEVAANQMQITRLQNAIKVTVNNELLFPRATGKCRWKPSGPSAKSSRPSPPSSKPS